MVKRNWNSVPFDALVGTDECRCTTFFSSLFSVLFSFITERETSFHFFLSLSPFLLHFFRVSPAGLCDLSLSLLHPLQFTVSVSFASTTHFIGRIRSVAEWCASVCMERGKTWVHDHSDDRVCDIGWCLNKWNARALLLMEERTCEDNEMYYSVRFVWFLAGTITTRLMRHRQMVRM